ncbi:DUF6153 family protein [Actinoplanes campanulatus]|nr:DUF6153 family protein [Actinoplanes capillaceus]
MGRVARWVLLACTLVGLSAMHTLGHAGMHKPGGHSAGVHVEGDSPVIRVLSADAGSGDHCAGCVHLRSGDGDPDGGMAGRSICLAVLTGFAVLILLAALLHAVLTRRRVPRLRGGRGAAPARAPPTGHVGLVLATDSVLRI